MSRLSLRPRTLALALAGALSASSLTGALIMHNTPEVKTAKYSDFGTNDGLNRFIVSLTPEVASTTSTSATPQIDVERLRLAQSTFPGGMVSPSKDGSVYFVSPTGGFNITKNAASYDALSVAELQRIFGEGLPTGSPAATSPRTSTKFADAPPVPVALPPGPLPKLVPQVDPATTLTPSSLSAKQIAALLKVPGVSSAQIYQGNQVLVAGSLSLEDARKLPGVESVEVAKTGEVAGESITDPYFSSYGYNLENTGANAGANAAAYNMDVNASDVYSVTKGQGSIVAVLDTGFDVDHTELVGSLWQNPNQDCSTTDTDKNGFAGDCHGWNFMTNSPQVNVDGENGTHGTSVAGVISAALNNNSGTAGVAPGVKIMPVVIGAGKTVSLEAAILGIYYAVDNGADVINASWGAQSWGSRTADLERAVAYADSHGVNIVAAAGNDGLDRDTNPYLPANLERGNVLTVGNMTATGTRSTSSAFGKKSVDIFAPGNLVFTTWNSGDSMLVSGTSIAAPQVAGAAALYRSMHPSWTASEIRDAIISSARPNANLKDLSASGGMLDLSRVEPALQNSVSYAFSGMSARPGVVSPRIKLTSTVSGTASYSVGVGLAMEVDGEVWAVGGAPLTLNGKTIPTSEEGFAYFPLANSTSLSSQDFQVSTPLDAGKYALVVQTFKDGEPLTRPYAAPLLVSTTPVSAPPAPSKSAPAPSQTVAPSGAPGTSPAPSSSASSTRSPGASANPTNSTPVVSPSAVPSVNPSVKPSGAPSSTASPGNTSSPRPSVPSSAPSPVSSAPSAGPSIPSSIPSTTLTPRPVSTPSATPSQTNTPSSSAPLPEKDTSKTFAPVGDLGVTSINPTKLPLSGGIVTISGVNMPSSTQVRVGASGQGELLSYSTGNGTSSVSVRLPARPAGVYDVVVYANGKASTLSDILTYGDATKATVSPAPVSPSSAPTGTPTTPASTAPSKPPVASPSPSTPGSQASTKTGPHGEKLYYSKTFSGLNGLWDTPCTDGCSGRQI